MFSSLFSLTFDVKCSISFDELSLIRFQILPFFKKFCKADAFFRIRHQHFFQDHPVPGICNMAQSDFPFVKKGLKHIMIFIVIEIRQFSCQNLMKNQTQSKNINFDRQPFIFITYNSPGRFRRKIYRIPMNFPLLAGKNLAFPETIIKINQLSRHCSWDSRRFRRIFCGFRSPCTIPFS